MAELSLSDLTVNLNDLTIGEIETIEDITGMAIDRIGDPTAPKGKMLRALAFVMMRRTNPDLTMGEVSDVKISLGGDDRPLDGSESESGSV